ncbi:M16 family metallopeptidase [Oscillatoria salina]|uniref:M16 family metallopeptidase n=1 Tax=Oscillatoria salina TaxID=331517 RepID=UPI001CD035AF|nr:pitrilysin family protein [Oscillatoria salina]MBZ8178671.1 insulinase family protein [Oscillatoria salina IIICB1]
MTSTLLSTPTLNAPTVRQLPNGLTIVAEQMAVDAVSLNIWLKVGSAVEPDAINGMAHFLEHMVFKGTPRLKAGDFERLIEERGAVTNAATSQDYTHYYITTAPKDFAKLAPLQIDVVVNPCIADDAFARERLVILEEIRRSEDNPRRRTFYRAMGTGFEHLPYRRSVLGPTEVISQLEAQQMRNFHSQWYRPELMTAAVVGNLPVEELIGIVNAGFEQCYSEDKFAGKMPWLGERETFFPEPSFTDIVRREYIDETLQQARLVMLWRVPGMNSVAETYALDILAAILGQGKMSRLFRDLREERQLVSSIGASNMTQLIQGAFYIYAMLPPENLTEVENAIAEHIRQLNNELIAEADITRLRTKVANRFVFANEKPSDRANLYGYYQSQIGDLAPAINYPDRIQAIEAVDLQIAAQRYLSFDAYGVVAVKPE